jgi:pimeloyl-ACP methyl ester carboxylesterase
MPAVLVRLLLAGWDTPLELVEIFQRSLSKVQPKVVAARVRAVLDVDVTSDLARLKVPTLYLAARRDGLVRRALREEVQRVLPKIEITDFETAHLILQRAPEEAARVIEEFVARC